jgi:hypothetical protein
MGDERCHPVLLFVQGQTYKEDISHGHHLSRLEQSIGYASSRYASALPVGSLSTSLLLHNTHPVLPLASSTDPIRAQHAKRNGIVRHGERIVPNVPIPICPSRILMTPAHNAVCRRRKCRSK